MTPEPPREYVAFVAQHLGRLRHDADLLAVDEYEAHELYSQALVDIAIRWQWFALLRRLNRPDAAEAYLHETLVRRSTRRQAEQADFVDFEVWLSEDPQATYPPAGSAAASRHNPDPPTQPLRSAAAPTRSGGTARMLPMSSFGIEVGPVTEAAVAWWHAYMAHRHARLGAATAAITLALAIALPFLQRH
jgi:hypothetical protein